MQPILLILDKMASSQEEQEPIEVVIRRVGMEDHINIVKLFQVRSFVRVPLLFLLAYSLIHRKVDLIFG